jgi:hypothetical protein
MRGRLGKVSISIPLRLWGVIQDAGLTILNHLDATKKSYEHIVRDPTPQRGIALGLPPLQHLMVHCCYRT